MRTQLEARRRLLPSVLLLFEARCVVSSVCIGRSSYTLILYLEPCLSHFLSTGPWLFKVFTFSKQFSYDLNLTAWRFESRALLRLGQESWRLVAVFLNLSLWRNSRLWDQLKPRWKGISLFPSGRFPWFSWFTSAFDSSFLFHNVSTSSSPAFQLNGLPFALGIFGFSFTALQGWGSGLRRQAIVFALVDRYELGVIGVFCFFLFLLFLGVVCLNQLLILDDLFIEWGLFWFALTIEESLRFSCFLNASIYVLISERAFYVLKCAFHE